MLLGYYNRRPLLLTGFIGVAAGHAVLALSFLLPESGFRSYLILAAMLVVVFFVQTFIGILVWLLLSEIFPMTIRGFAMGIAVFVLWTVNAAISFAFPPLVAALGASLTFGLFAIDQHRVDPVRQEVRPGDPRAHPGGAGGRLPGARRRALRARRAGRTCTALDRTNGPDWLVPSSNRCPGPLGASTRRAAGPSLRSSRGGV